MKLLISLKSSSNQKINLGEGSITVQLFYSVTGLDFKQICLLAWIQKIQTGVVSG